MNKTMESFKLSLPVKNFIEKSRNSHFSHRSNNSSFGRTFENEQIVTSTIDTFYPRVQFMEPKEKLPSLSQYSSHREFYKTNTSSFNLNIKDNKKEYNRRAILNKTGY
jgi:hypothetical protein